MLETTPHLTVPRLLLQAITLALVTALAGGAAAQDRPAKKAPAAKPAKKRATPRRAKRVKKAKPKKREDLSKKQRDAQDDAHFDGATSPKADAPPRPPVSTEGPWPHEDDAPWATDDDSPWPAEGISREEEEELFGDLDEDMESPAEKREAEQRGSTSHPYHHPVPSPDADGWQVQPSASPEVLEWHEGADMPDGYVKATRVRKGLVITGAVLFGVSWLATAGYGTYLINQRQPDFWERENDDGPRPETVLYIPLVGPWIALGTVDHDSREGAAFITGGIVQAGSVAMLIAGVAAKKTVLVKTKNTELGVAPTPTGGMLHGRF